MITSIRQLRWLLSALLIAATDLLVIGVAVERSNSDHHDETTAHVAGESAEHQGEAAEAAASAEHGEQRTLGIDRESPAIVVPAVVLSLLLAVLVWFRRDLWLLWTIVVVALDFAVFEVAEVVHQLNEHRNGLALLAGIVALLHLATSFVAEVNATHPATRNEQWATAGVPAGRSFTHRTDSDVSDRLRRVRDRLRAPGV